MEEPTLPTVQDLKNFEAALYRYLSKNDPEADLKLCTKYVVDKARARGYTGSVEDLFFIR